MSCKNTTIFLVSNCSSKEISCSLCKVLDINIWLGQKTPFIKDTRVMFSQILIIGTVLFSPQMSVIIFLFTYVVTVRKNSKRVVVSPSTKHGALWEYRKTPLRNFFFPFILCFLIRKININQCIPHKPFWSPFSIKNASHYYVMQSGGKFLIRRRNLGSLKCLWE